MTQGVTTTMMVLLLPTRAHCESCPPASSGQWEMISLLHRRVSEVRTVSRVAATRVQLQVHHGAVDAAAAAPSGKQQHPLAPSSGGRKQIVCPVGQSLLSSHFCRGGHNNYHWLAEGVTTNLIGISLWTNSMHLKLPTLELVKRNGP